MASREVGRKAFSWLLVDRRWQQDVSSTLGAYAHLQVNEIREFRGEHADDIFPYKFGIFEELPSDDEISRWVNAIGPAEAF